MIFKLFLFLFFTIASLYGDDIYDLNILNLQAKVFPKIILSDSDIAKKTTNNTIIITILYTEIDKQTALKFQKMIQNNYQNLKDFGVSVELQKYQDFLYTKEVSSAYIFLLGESNEQIKSIAKTVTSNNRLSFSYDAEYLDYGVIMGLEVKAKVSLTININTLKQSQIKLDNSIFKVAKIR